MSRVDWRNFTRFHTSCSHCGVWVECQVQHSHQGQDYTCEVYAEDFMDDGEFVLLLSAPWASGGLSAQEWVNHIKTTGTTGLFDLLGEITKGRGLA
jgi:dTDP-glucose pyrophosphorylase